MLFFFLGLAQVWDMMTGINGEIIVYSKYYRFNLFLTLFLAITNIIGNWFFIEEYGITGAALATCLSFFMFNVAKFIFIRIKYGFQPFSPKLIPVLGFGIGAWIVSSWLPDTSHPFLTMVIKGFMFCLLYGGAMWKLNISPDINDWLQRSWMKIRPSRKSDNVT